ncbi:hypothetical protein H8356DRAFT_1329525 [Neocallimastix lanati (nom. inval.)]|nr:hypothetical protein H8356DRAFT_1329525 [Neocallimastix sp. JGI-2020a]
MFIVSLNYGIYGGTVSNCFSNYFLKNIDQKTYLGFSSSLFLDKRFVKIRTPFDFNLILTKKKNHRGLRRRAYKGVPLMQREDRPLRVDGKGITYTSSTFKYPEFSIGFRWARFAKAANRVEDDYPERYMNNIESSTENNIANCNRISFRESRNINIRDRENNNIVTNNNQINSSDYSKTPFFGLVLDKGCYFESIRVNLTRSVNSENALRQAKQGQCL